MRYDFFGDNIPRQKLADILLQRIPLLYLEESDEFLPPGDSFGEDEVVQYIRDQAKPRQHIRDVYMAALDNRSRGGEAASSRYSNTRSRASKVDNPPTANTHATNDGGNPPTATFDGGGTSNTVGITRNSEDNVAGDPNVTPVVPSEVGDDPVSDNNSPVDTVRRRFRFGRVTEDLDEDSDEGKVNEIENLQIGDEPEDNISGISV